MILIKGYSREGQKFWWGEDDREARKGLSSKKDKRMAVTGVRRGTGRGFYQEEDLSVTKC